MRPDLAKFCNFGPILKVFGIVLVEGLIKKRQNFGPTFRVFYAIGHILWPNLGLTILPSGHTEFKGGLYLPI